MKLENYEKIAELLEVLEAEGYALQVPVRDQLDSFLGLVEGYGEAFGVVSRNDIRRGAFDHVVDSLSLVPSIVNAVCESGFRYIDVGSGGGFPGIVCACFLRGQTTTLIERSERKCAFLRRALAELRLTDTEVFCESYDRYDWAEGPVIVSVRGLEMVGEELPHLLGLLLRGSVCYWLTGARGRVDFGERFHVEQIVDGWTSPGLRRGMLYSIRVER